MHIEARKAPLSISEALDELVRALEGVDDLMTLRNGLGISVALVVASGDPRIQAGAPVYAAVEGVAEAVQLRREGRHG